MARLYISVNGDDVGSKIGDAIASNDHMALQEASGALNDSHAMIEEWVTSKGGQVISSSGDEGLYICPEECVQELDQIRQQYSEMSGHTITVGIGSSMADASKAMIYGKLNNKNQVVHYEPSIDDYLSQEQVQGAEQAEMQAQQDPNAAPEENGAPPMDQMDPNAAPMDQMDPNAAPMDQAPAPMDQNAAPADPNAAPMNPSVPPVNPNAAPADQNSAATEEQQDEVLNESQIAAGQDNQPTMEDPNNNIESPQNEVGEIGDELEDDNSVDEYETTDPQSVIDELVQQEDNKDISGEQNMNPMAEKQINPTEGELENAVPNPAEQNQEIGNESEDELAGMVQNDMENAGAEDGQEQEIPMDPKAPMNGEEVPAATPTGEHADIKAGIMDCLHLFKIHKQDLDGLGSQNPELHDAMILMLQHMIEMGRRLTEEDGSEEDQENEEEMDELTEEFPEADPENGDADEKQDDVEEEVDEHNEEEHGEDPKEDSAIKDDKDPKDATPENEEKEPSKDSPFPPKKESSNENPFPPKKDDKEKLEKK